MATVAAVQNLPQTNRLCRAVAICYCDESKSHRTIDVSTKSTDYALLINSLQSLSCGAIRHKSRRVSPRQTRKAPPQICLALQSTSYIGFDLACAMLNYLFGIYRGHERGHAYPESIS